jgi:hypothetical protein
LPAAAAGCAKASPVSPESTLVSSSSSAQAQQQEQPAGVMAGSSGRGKAFKWKAWLKGGNNGSLSPGTAQQVGRSLQMIMSAYMLVGPILREA